MIDPFIEVHDVDGTPSCVKLSKIEAFGQLKDGSCFMSVTCNANFFMVKETYEQLKSIMKTAAANQMMANR